MGKDVFVSYGAGGLAASRKARACARRPLDEPAHVNVHEYPYRHKTSYER